MSFREGIDDQGTYYQINEVAGTTPIIFIHGVGLDHSIWSPQVEFFKNSTTIVYDLLGHGLSTCTSDKIEFEDFGSPKYFKFDGHDKYFAITSRTAVAIMELEEGKIV